MTPNKLIRDVRNSTGTRPGAIARCGQQILSSKVMAPVNWLASIAFSHFKNEMAKGDVALSNRNLNSSRFVRSSFVIAALLFFPSVMAATGGGATIHNAATATYIGGSVTASVDVTVITLAATPQITVDSAAQTVAATATATYNYTLINNSNGVDTFSITAASVDVGMAGAPGLNINGTGTPSDNFTLGASIANSASDALGNIYIPAGSETDLIVGDEIAISGVGSYTIATLTPGTPASTTGGVTTPETSTQMTLTPIGAAPAIGAGTVALGTQIGEQVTFPVVVTANTPAVVGVDGTHTVNLSGSTTATDAAYAIVNYSTSAGNSNETVTTVTSTTVNFVKEVRNVTKGTAFATSGITAETGDILEYRITATPTPGGGDLLNSLLVDDLPADTSYVANSYTLNGVGGASATLPSAGAGIAIYSPSGSPNTLVDGESAVVTFQATVDPVAAGTVITNTADLTFTGGSANAVATATVVVRTASAIELLQYGVASPLEYVPVPQCDSGGGFTPLGAPVVGGVPLPVPGNLGLDTVTSYATDEAIFVRLTDADQNIDPLTAETVLVTLTVAASGDSEVIRITETGINTGIFVGYIQATTVPAANDCLLSVVAGQPVTASYVDVNDGADTSSVNAPVGAGTSGIFLTNTAQKTSAVLGEVVAFQSDITNSTVSGISGTVVTIALPAGLRYQPGSTLLDGTPVADPTVSADGRSLAFSVGAIAASVTTRLRYVVAITAGSRPGRAINTANATANGGIVSNTAQAQILVEEEPIISRSLLMGRVMVGNCQAYPNKGNVGIRLQSQSVEDRVDYRADVSISNIAVEGLHVIVRLPEVLEYLPESVKLNGRGIKDPQIDGNTLRFFLGNQEADSQSSLVFSTRSQLRVFGEFSTRAYGEFSTRANADFKTTEAVAQRTPVAVNRVKDYSRIVRPRFDTLSADLKPGDTRDLDDLAASLYGHKVKKIYIIGHADAQPIRAGKDTPFKNNEALSIARANSVAQYLDNKLKLGGTKFQISGAGAKRPLYYNKRLEGRELSALESLALNRRVEVLVEVEGQDTETRFLVSKSDSGLKSTEFFMTQDNNGKPTVGQGIPGAKGIRLYLEDGQFVDTDEQGMFHFDGLRPGTHVVQIDTDSLPDHLELDRCEENTRFAGTPHSRFVDIRAGSLWRADFYLKRKAATHTSGAIGLRLSSKLDGNDVLFTLDVTGNTIAFKKRRIIITLPEGIEYDTGSSRLDGRSVADPVRDADVYEFRLDDIARPDWKQSFSFKAKVVKSQEGEFATFAYMIFETQNGKQQSSSIVENTLVRQALNVRRFVYDASFEGTGADLTPRDEQTLDGIIDYLRGKSIRNVYIRSRFGDNPEPGTANSGDTDILFDSRAAKIGNYLATALRLQKQQIHTSAAGTDNNRVEIYISMVDESAPYSVKINRGDSELQNTGVVSSTPYPEKAPFVPLNNKVVEDPLEEGVLNVREGQRFAHPVLALRTRMDSRLKPELRIDGVIVPKEQIGFKQTVKSTGKTTYTYIGVDLGEPGKHNVTLKGLDPFGNARVDQNINYVRTSEVDQIRVVSTDGNVADGKTPVKIRVEVLDKNGDVINAAVNLKLKDSELKPYRFNDSLPELRKGEDVVEVTRGGEILFDPVSTSGTKIGKLFYNKIEIDFRTYIKPVYRDWIMVGVAEGTMAHKTLSGSMQNLADADLTDDFFQDGRLAFLPKVKSRASFCSRWRMTVTRKIRRINTDYSSSWIRTSTTHSTVMEPNSARKLQVRPIYLSSLKATISMHCLVITIRD